MSNGENHTDVIIIGGGIAGATAAYQLSQAGQEVSLLEQEAELAHHTTSRSAAIYVEHEGGPTAQRLSAASRTFLEDPPVDIDSDLMTPCGSMTVGTDADVDRLLNEAAEAQIITPTIAVLRGSSVTDLCPVLRPERATIGVFEPNSKSVDVMALHQLYLRGATAHGLAVHRSARVQSLTRSKGTWVAHTPAGDFRAPVVVNAAGAWGDVVGAMAGAEPIGLAPKRRTAFTTGIDQDPTPWPFIYNGTPGESCYFKPEAGNQLLCSLADEGESEPTDARPQELDIALAIDRINTLSTLGIRSVRTTWAGLRTFAPDRNQVLGWDDKVDGFCWMVGQGGTGITTSPAAGAMIAAIVTDSPVPDSLTALGLTKEALAPRRHL